MANVLDAPTTDTTTTPLLPPRADVATILYFTAKWCGPSRSYDPVVAAAVLPKAPGDTRTLTLVTLDIDEQEAQALEAKVIAVPTLVAVDAAGKHVGQLLGTRTEDVVREWLADPTATIDP